MTNTDTDGTTNGKTKTEKLGIVPMDKLAAIAAMRCRNASV